MNIIVCVKQVPNTNEVKINKETGTLIREGVESIINPDDKNAIEAALVLKEQVGAKVTLLSMGPPQAKAALKDDMKKMTEFGKKLEQENVQPKELLIYTECAEVIYSYENKEQKYKYCKK